MSGKSTSMGDEVTVNAGSSGPYGVTLAAGPNDSAARIVSWERLPNGKFGCIQKDGGVRLGDVLFKLNSTLLNQHKFEDVMKMLRNPGILQKKLSFMSRDQYIRKYCSGSNSRHTRNNLAKTNLKDPSSVTGEADNSNDPNFISVIRKARINKSSGPSFAEYEVACSLRTNSKKVSTDNIRRWSVWKRFSEFESLDTSLRAEFGWQIDKARLTLPSKNNFTIGKLSGDFIEKRRAALDRYWQMMLAIDRISDFAKIHHCSNDLKAFLQVAQHMTAEIGARGGGSDDDERPISSDRRKSVKAAGKQRRKSTARPTSMRKTKSSAPNSSSSAPPPAPAAAPAAAPSPAPVPAPAPSPSQSNVPEEVKPFLKMVKMGIPHPAVAMKMQMAGVDPSLLDKYGSVDEAPAETTAYFGGGGTGGVVGGGGGGRGGGLPPPPAAKKAPKPAPQPKKSAPPPKPGKAGGMSMGLLGDIAKRRID